MNAYKLVEAGVNVGEGVRRFNGNAALYERLLKKFALDANYAALCAALAAGDVNAAFAAAHTLKGTAGNLSLIKLYNDLAPLVEQLRSGRTDGLEPLLAPVTNDRRAILSALEENA